LAFFCLLVLALPVSAKDDKKKENANVPFYQGITVGVEFGGPIRKLLSDNWSTSAKMDINFKNKYLPTFEFGQASYDKTGETGVHYTTTGLFLKAGLNLPVVIHGAKAEDLFYVGLHYGFSSFSYNLGNLTYQDGYWNQPVTSSLTGEKSVAGWADAVAGVRIKVLGPFSLGWSIHYKTTLHVSDGANSVPQYIPGYGQNVKPFSSINAHLYYRLPF